ncbi:MAG: ATP-binding protein, partial [Myxococcota bacterium]
ASDAENESVEAIQRAATDASILCAQLLALNPGLRESTRRAVTLQEIVGELRPMIRSVLPESLALEFEVHEPAPAIIADPIQIRQSILNLCLNARDASSSGGRVVVSVGTEADGRARLAVRDFGEGISPENRERLFEPFFTTKETGQGTGLGLAAVDAIVTAHGGEIRVDSTPGEGTTFELVFPAAPDESGQSASLDDGKTPKTHALEILYVEDNEAIRRAGVRLLQGAGHRVNTAASDEEAMKLAESKGFDVVLTDVVLADGLGPELVQKLRKLHGPIPAVLVSGYTEGWNEELDERTVFLRKPYNSKDLDDALRRVTQTANGRS